MEVFPIEIMDNALCQMRHVPKYGISLVSVYALSMSLPATNNMQIIANNMVSGTTYTVLR